MSYNWEVTQRLSNVAVSELAARAFARMTWPQEPEGFEYRFCLPASPVIHFLREIATGKLVAFRILDGSFVAASANVVG